MKKILLRIFLALGVFILIVVANYFAFNIIASRITEGETISSKGSEKTALLVIDIQERLSAAMDPERLALLRKNTVILLSRSYYSTE